MNSHPPTATPGQSETPALESTTEVDGTTALGLMQLSSQDIFAGAREVEIKHGNVLYRLRQTSLGKLILTK